MCVFVLVFFFLLSGCRPRSTLFPYTTLFRSSKMRSGAVRGLRVAGLEDAFQVIVGADEVTHPKPHPEPVLTALERLGAPATGAVFVGDSRHDVECGRAAGVKTAAVLWGPFDRSHLEDLEPDYWLETPAALAAVD